MILLNLISFLVFAKIREFNLIEESCKFGLLVFQCLLEIYSHDCR